MTLVEDYSHVAVVEVLSVLRKMSEHCGPEFQTTSKAIKQTLRERFGISFARQGAGRKLFRHVVNVLLERGVLELWDMKQNAQSSLAIYQVNTTLLHE